jgi:aconitate hydratase
LFPTVPGLPVLMDLAAARDVVAEQGGDAANGRARVPVTLVVDHS